MASSFELLDLDELQLKRKMLQQIETSQQMKMTFYQLRCFYLLGLLGKILLFCPQLKAEHNILLEKSQMLSQNSQSFTLK